MLGRVLSVDTVPRGSYVAQDTPAGSVVLLVEHGVDFSDAGGVLAIVSGDDTYDEIPYSSRTDDTLSLSSGLPVGLDAGEPVYVWPLAPEKRAQVRVDPAGTPGESDTIDAVVTSPMGLLLGDGVRGSDAATEAVILEQIDERWYVVSFDAESTKILESALPPIAGAEQVAYYSPEPPDLTADDAGKVWYDTDGGMAVSRWDGTAWVAAPIGSVAMAETLVGKVLIGGEVHASTIYMGDTGARMVLVNSAPEGVSGASQRILGYTGYVNELPAEIYFRGYVDELSRTVVQTFVGSPRFDSSGFARLLLESRDDGTSKVTLGDDGFAWLLLESRVDGMSKATLGANVVTVDAPMGFSTFLADKVVTSRVETPSGMAIISVDKTLTGGSPGSYLSGLTVVEGDMVASTGVITVPGDLSMDEQHRVRIEANVCLSNSATRAYIEILDASGARVPGGRVEAGNASATYKTLDIGRSIPCWAGDTFQVRVYCAATTTMLGATIPVLLQAWME